MAVRFPNDASGGAATLKFETYWLIPVVVGGSDVVDHFRDEQEVDAALRFFAILKCEKLPPVVAWDQLGVPTHNFTKRTR